MSQFTTFVLPVTSVTFFLMAPASAQTSSSTPTYNHWGGPVHVEPGASPKPESTKYISYETQRVIERQEDRLSKVTETLDEYDSFIETCKKRMEENETKLQQGAINKAEYDRAWRSAKASIQDYDSKRVSLNREKTQIEQQIKRLRSGTN